MLSALPLSLLVAIPLVGAAPYCKLSKPESAAVSTSSGTTGSGNTSTPSDLVAASWYAGWNAADFPPSNISWSKYSTVNYAFAPTTPDSSTITLESTDEQLLPQFVELAHQNNVKAVLTIGGWSGSQYFSTAVATSANRTNFVNAVTGLISKYDLDGVDFDWEYPNKQGIGCNTINADDSANFLSMMQQLRSQAGSNLTISAAVSITPFVGSDGSPMTDVSEFAKVLDYIEIMNYDIWGSWSTGVGPNAPLNDTCASPSDQQGSAVSAVKAWTAAGMPASQIVLGVAAYGHSFFVPSSSASTSASNSTLTAYPVFEKSEQPSGDAWSGDASWTAGTVDQCGNPTTKAGTFDFWGMVDAGFLTSNGSVASGMLERYDECSQTPYVYNPTSQVMISYDNAQSFTAKGQFINTAGLAGFAMWETGSDYNDVLLDAITQGVGVESGVEENCLDFD